MRLWSADKGWRTGTIKAYHGGYLRHTGGCLVGSACRYPSPGLLELLWLARLCWHGGCCSPVAAVELNMFSMHRALCA